jgi:hypothetical protein
MYSVTKMMIMKNIKNVTNTIITPILAFDGSNGSGGKHTPAIPLGFAHGAAASLIPPRLSSGAGGNIVSGSNLG